MGRSLRLILITAAFVFVGAMPAFAYQESSSTVDPADTPAYSCPSCHGLESGFSSPTVGPVVDGGTRKGPHGGYGIGTNKCETCHTLHGAASARALLPDITIEGTCNTCHDGTGGGGVYGVIKRRTGEDPAGGHMVGGHTGGKVSIPGGNADGSDLDYQFSVVDEGMTCTDCHSPHDSNTVAPFLGDRARSSDDTTSATIKTDRLLLARPTSSDTTVTIYGSDWCLSCHKGQARGTMTHPVASLEETTVPSTGTQFKADYDHVARLSAYDTATVDPDKGALGQSNLGYVVPEGSGGLPICQQCHEDARDIANDPVNNPGVISSTTESFTAAVDGAGSGNPRFQNFPHETLNVNMLVEPRDSLCLNCHATALGDAVH
ncbi:MAG TPA: cytochrome c3 family protein [Coriobacteriia bacterium]|nr:cytochrome c3 family protein [Coriobacteriia bacterium]